MRVPLVDVAAQERMTAPAVLEAIAQVARDGQFVLGPRVEAFERWLAATSEASHAVGVASGTEAIELSLRAFGIGAGDAVITPAFSFIAAAEAVVAAGARPVFCDVDPVSLNATAETVGGALARARAAGCRVRAVVPVHLFGLCSPTAALAELARREGLVILEDAAQALGAHDDGGRPAGSSGAAGAFSFFPTKNLGAWGDGGAVVTSDGEVAARVRRLRTHGATGRYIHAEHGRNSRLDAVQAAVLLAKAPFVSEWLAARCRLARRYLDALASLPLDLPQSPEPPAVHAWHAFVVRIPRRDELGTWLHDHGVETRVYYPVPLHRQPCFAALAEPPLPVAERACQTALALPLFAAMSDEQQAHVIQAIARFLA
jgi:dTDP-4-amino-4,6-dideoxygalactose transaminase